MKKNISNARGRGKKTSARELFCKQITIDLEQFLTKKLSGDEGVVLQSDQLHKNKKTGNWYIYREKNSNIARMGTFIERK
jgi:hypothetical protein